MWKFVRLRAVTWRSCAAAQLSPDRACKCWRLPAYPKAGAARHTKEILHCFGTLKIRNHSATNAIVAKLHANEAARTSTPLTQNHRRLPHVIEAWSQLPEAICRAVLVLIRTAG